MTQKKRKLTAKFTPDPVQPAEDPRNAAAKRAEDCFNDLAAVLEKHRCRIGVVVGTITPVGDGSQGLIAPRWGVFPNPP